MLALMIILTGLMVFLVFTAVSAILFNATIKKCAHYRYKPQTRAKILHNLYTMAYSAIFSTMLIASVCFPAFASSFYEPINFDIPTIQTVIVESAQDIVNDLQTVGDINIFNELDEISRRFENEDVFRN